MSMHIICNDCGKTFNFSAVPRFCPLCGSSDVERDVRKQRARALKLIAEYNDIVKKILVKKVKKNNIYFCIYENCVYICGVKIYEEKQ